MRKPTRRTEVGRGERVVPGVWRLRLPLPWPGIPHCNAWALSAGDGLVLVDCGLDAPGSLRNLERALEPVGQRLEDVRLLVCTHAHIDHCGQAAAVQARAGCELWITRATSTSRRCPTTRRRRWRGGSRSPGRAGSRRRRSRPGRRAAAPRAAA